VQPQATAAKEYCTASRVGKALQAPGVFLRKIVENTEFFEIAKMPLAL